MVKNQVLLEETDHLLRSVWQKYQQYLLPQGELSAHQVYFLRYLEGRKTCTPSDISQEFGITLGAVTGFVDRLYNLKLISRTRSEEDRRIVLIELTEKGREFLLEFKREREEKHSRLLAILSEAEAENLNSSLTKLKQALDKLE